MTDEKRNAIEAIISNMETLNGLWWAAEENKDEEAKAKHDKLETQIRADMSAIGIDFDTVGAEYEDMINKLRAMTRSDRLSQRHKAAAQR